MPLPRRSERSTSFPYTTLFRSLFAYAVPRAKLRSAMTRSRSAVAPICVTALTITHPTNDNQPQRSEEHTSELQSQSKLVCRLVLEKKKIVFGFVLLSEVIIEEC